MLIPIRFLARLLLFVCMLLFASSLAAGQSIKPDNTASTTTIITATATEDRVRFAAPGLVVQIRVQVLSDAGQVLFDTETRGNVFDWSGQDGTGQRLADGNYLSVVTIKSLSGRLSQKICAIQLTGEKIDLQSIDRSQLTPSQQQVVGPVEDESAISVLQLGEVKALTTVDHNGNQGELTRTTGALSFRLGDFFSGKDQEQMRLTEEGNLGIGTDKPQSKLDVAGDIRTTGALRARSIEFPNGTVQTSGQSGKLDAQGNVVPSATGTGTQDQLAKWTDNSGTLGDSLLSESGGNIVNNGASIQMTAAASTSVDTNLIFVNGNDRTTGVIASSTPSFQAANGPYFAMRGNQYSAFTGQRGLFAISAGNVSSPTGREGSVIFNTGPDQIRMIVSNNGNVGVGTTTPGSLLDVAGNINTSTQYNISGNRVLATPGTNNTFAGAGAGAVTTGTDNTFVGFNAGNANTTNVNFPANENSFFGSRAGEANTTGIRNAFFGANAGRFNTTGNDNCIFGDRAGVLNNGGANAIFGTGAGAANTTGSINSFFGRNAGNQNSTGANNSFFGGLAGNNNTTGSNNSFFGENAGLSNSAENNNTFIGANANGVAGIINAAAIGANAQVLANNSLVLGSINGVNGANADTNVGIGVTSPEQRLTVGGGVNVDQNNVNSGSIVNGLNFGHASGEGLASNRNAGANQFGLDFYTFFLKRMSITQSGNVGIGTSSPSAILEVRDGTGSSGSGAHVQIGEAAPNADEKLIAFGNGGCNGGPCVYLGEQDANDRMVLRAGTFRVKGGNWNPDIDNSIQLGQPSNRWSEVWAANGTVQTSDARLKQRITNLNYGLSQVLQLRPVTFQWKAGSDRRTHVGLIAQEVEPVMPEMIERAGDANAPLGMNYNNLIPVLIKAVQEQQTLLKRNEAAITKLRIENEKLNHRITALNKNSHRRKR